MNYEDVYYKLCQRGKTRNKTRGSNLEKHHIIPTFFYKNSKRNLRYTDGIYKGDCDQIGNITYLTPREHFIAHLLLCKIWKDTKWEYRCYLSIKMFLNGGELNNKRSVFQNSSRKYEYYKIKANCKISEGKSGTIPAKDAETGKRLGIVSINHPKVLSSQWVHITKGMKKSKEQRQKYSKPGTSNSNSKYTDEQLLESYKKCCYHYGKVVNGSLWIFFAEKHKLPYLKFWKQFRFDNKGFSGMVEKLLEVAKKDNMDLETNIDYKSHDWRRFVTEEKKKWA
jgi:hypothetical protein